MSAIISMKRWQAYILLLGTGFALGVIASRTMHTIGF